MKITNKLIEVLNPCESRFNNYLTHYKGKSHTEQQFMGLKKITHEDKLWVAFRSMPIDKVRLAAADIAESVLYLFEAKYPNDLRPRKAIEAARLHNDAAAHAANAAARAAATAAAAADAAARAAAAAAADAAARAAADAAYATARAAAHAANAAARAAAHAAHAAADAAYFTAADAAYSVAARAAAAYAAAADAAASRLAQEKLIRKIILKYWKD